MKRFSDFATEEAQLEGVKVKLDDLLNQDIILIAFRVSDSQYSKNKSGKYATVQFKQAENCPPQVFFTGSDILIEQLEKYRHELPFVAKVKKINRYYTLN
ncbi:MAG: hypothetical protein AB7U05_08900 [Mangrovibacterium sp.]